MMKIPFIWQQPAIIDRHPLFDKHIPLIQKNTIFIFHIIFYLLHHCSMSFYVGLCTIALCRTLRLRCDFSP
ncbi:hypothetical protein Dda3937_04487 [Dickeya dadantii 3937]|uniref:Uncharacterized protein n=1 Tax=Dickeya dadantii (strain 3937) TaxID=198628 RepID=E0SBU1_DICD3|nr:hypothetical protein Dda3937_04487 [Dickeya dadantii 3937]